MAASTSRRTVPAPMTAAASSLALAVADANWYTTANLFDALDHPGVDTLSLRCLDYYNAWTQGRAPWTWGRPLARVGDHHWRRELVLPSGWMKSFPRLGMRPIRREIDAWRSAHAPGSPLALVMTYPHYLYLRDALRPDKSVYFNIDDYAQYWPRRAAQVDALERRAVRESDLTVCVSRLRAEALRAAVPSAADRVHHLPHGTPASALSAGPRATPGPAPADLAALPRPILGYVGGLEDRVDWPLVEALAVAFPQASIAMIGRPSAGPLGLWQAERARARARPNVHFLGWKPQAQLDDYNRAFDLCLIPYAAEHPFNVACCPTKIMDSMATGRPIVSTDLPECRLYEHLFDVAAGREAFVAAVGSILDRGSDDGRSAERHAWAVDNSCRRVADRLLSWVMN